jgi:hypothetical protein
MPTSIIHVTWNMFDPLGPENDCPPSAFDLVRLRGACSVDRRGRERKTHLAASISINPKPITSFFKAAELVLHALYKMNTSAIGPRSRVQFLSPVSSQDKQTVGPDAVCLQSCDASSSLQTQTYLPDPTT